MTKTTTLRYIVEQRADRTRLFDVIDTQHGYTVKSFFTEEKAKMGAAARNAIVTLQGGHR